MGRSTARGSSPSFARRLVAVAALWALVGLSALAQQPPAAHLLRFEGMITGALADAVIRKIEDARKAGVGLFILEMKTGGGGLQPSKDLADYIFRLDDIRVVAYVNWDAYSGGTLVALACDAIYIDASTGRMGDVAPVDPAGNIFGEKLQSPLRDIMETYARARGYPEALAAAMVTKELEVFRLTMHGDPKPWYVTGDVLDTWSDEQRGKIVGQPELIVAAGQLLTLNTETALEYGFARDKVTSRENLYDVLQIEPGQVTRVYLTGSERVVTFLDMFSPLLLVAGFLLLYMELNQPGFGLAGVLSLACFAVFLLVKWTQNYANLLEILLFFAGLALLLVEVFLIPGFGFVGVLGIVLLVVSLVLMFQQFQVPRSGSEFHAFELNIVKVLGSLAASMVAIAVLIRLTPSLPVLSRLVQRADLAGASAGELIERRAPHVAEMVGRVGTALTPLRPAGRVEFDGVRLDVVTQGEFVEKGEPVQVLAVHGSRVVVEPYRQA